MRNYLLGIEIVVRGVALVKIKQSRGKKTKTQHSTRHNNKSALLVVVQRKCNEFFSIARSLN